MRTEGLAGRIVFGGVAERSFFFRALDTVSGPTRAAVRRCPPWGQADDPLLAQEERPLRPDVDPAALYRSEAASLSRYVFRRLGCREETQDIVQEAFSRFLRAGSCGGAALDRPQGYLVKVAQNLLRNRARDRWRRSAHLHVAAETQALAGPDPQRLLESRDMLQRLEAALLKLKPKTREIFLAHRLDGMSYAEIAQRTGLSVSGVEKQMSKAIAHIDRMIERP